MRGSIKPTCKYITIVYMVIDHPRLMGFTGKMKMRTVSADFIRYTCTGATCAFVDLTTYIILSKVFGIHPGIANLISRPIGGTVGFFMHKFWTFQNRGDSRVHVQYIKFWCVWAVSFSLSEGLVLLFYSTLNMGSIISKIAAECICGIFNFIVLRHWTFR